MTGPFPLLFQCVFYDIDDLCSLSDFRAWYLLALGLTFFFPLLFERFSVCLSFVYLETMFGSHRSWLARYIGPLLVFYVKWGVVYSGVFPCFFPKTPAYPTSNYDDAAGKISYYSKTC